MAQRIVRQRIAGLASALAILLTLSLGGCARSREASSTSPGASDTPRGGVKVTFIELGSVNCVPCKMMQPIMREVEAIFPRDVEVVFHDVWTEKGKPYATQFKIKVIPTQVFLDAKGREFFRHEGFFPRDDLVRLLKEHGAER
jgi:thioredoxin 1